MGSALILLPLIQSTGFRGERRSAQGGGAGQERALLFRSGLGEGGWQRPYPPCPSMGIFVASVLGSLCGSASAFRARPLSHAVNRPMAAVNPYDPPERVHKGLRVRDEVGRGPAGTIQTARARGPFSPPARSALSAPLPLLPQRLDPSEARSCPVLLPQPTLPCQPFSPISRRWTHRLRHQNPEQQTHWLDRNLTRSSHGTDTAF